MIALIDKDRMLPILEGGQVKLFRNEDEAYKWAKDKFYTLSFLTTATYIEEKNIPYFIERPMA